MDAGRATTRRPMRRRVSATRRRSDHLRWSPKFTASIYTIQGSIFVTITKSKSNQKVSRITKIATVAGEPKSSIRRRGVVVWGKLGGFEFAVVGASMPGGRLGPDWPENGIELGCEQCELPPYFRRFLPPPMMI